MFRNHILNTPYNSSCNGVPFSRRQEIGNHHLNKLQTLQLKCKLKLPQINNGAFCCGQLRSYGHATSFGLLLYEGRECTVIFNLTPHMFFCWWSWAHRGSELCNEASQSGHQIWFSFTLKYSNKPNRWNNTWVQQSVDCFPVSTSFSFTWKPL